MKFFLVLLLLAGLAFGGYTYYIQSTRGMGNISNPVENIGKLSISNQDNKLSDLAAVLGASVRNTILEGQDYLADVTNGASEPIINELVSKTTETLKDLPRKEAEKIKYEFCKGVITEYEGAKGETLR